MKARVWCVFVLSLVGAGAASAQEGPRVEPGGPVMVPPMRMEAGPPHLPQRPFEVLQRFFELGPEQRRLVEEMRRQWQTDFQEAVRKIEADLDAQYAAQLKEALGPGEAAALEKVLAAIPTYQDALRLAEADFRAEWQRITGNPPSFVPRTSSQILSALPGLDRQIRQDITRTLYTDLYRTLNDAVNKSLEEKGITRPGDRADRQAWIEYSRAREQIQREIYTRLQEEAVEKAKGMLPAPLLQQYEEVGRALDEMAAKQAAALEALKKELEGVVPAERIAPIGEAGPFGAVRMMEVPRPEGR